MFAENRHPRQGGPTGRLEPAFNELIHAPLRLLICGLLRNADDLGFSVARDTLDVDVDDAKLSKNLKVLARAGASPSATTAQQR